MSLPVSHYEALLAEVRGLRRKAQRVQQLATPLISNSRTTTKSFPTTSQQYLQQQQQQDDDLNFEISLLNIMDPVTNLSSNYDGMTNKNNIEGDVISEDEFVGAARNSTHLSVSSEPITQRDKGLTSVLYHGTWPNEKTMWNSDPTTFKPVLPAQHVHMQDVNSVMSFDSSAGAMALDRFLGSPNLSRRSSQQLEAKFDMVYSLLSMLSGQEHADMGETLLALSTNTESCLAMRQSGCIPLLVQMIQSDKEKETRIKASQALQNLIQFQPDEKLRKREIRVFKLLEQTRTYIDALKLNNDIDLDNLPSTSEDTDRHPVQTIAHLMKLSFDEGHRQAICQLGGIHIISNLVEIEHSLHGSITEETHCILMRRYACMALTNLTFGDSGNKLLLCSFKEFMKALVVQLQSPSDELRQVTASVLRNLSWRAEANSKEILREVGTVSGLMKAAMLDNKENTLKSILSALWNLSAHSTENKSEICSIDGALGFLVDMLTYKTPSKSLAIIENAGGILRNISSQIAVRDDYREILRQHNCLQILLEQLKSPSLTIVSNACGTLWNLSAKCQIDQEKLWEMGAPAMLRSLNHSKHKMIAMGSSAALKNLLTAKPTQTIIPQLDSTALSMDLPVLPTLGARKQKNLMQDLDHTLSETYENIEKDSPIKQIYKEQNDDKTNNYKYKSGDYNSLNCEPSTSKTTIIQNSGSSSLPYIDTPKQQSKIAIPVRRQQQNEPKLLRNKPKKIAKNASSISIESRKEYRNESDIIIDYSSINSSSSSSVDNDKQKRKEIHSDEKDRCSIEDISDTDGNYQHKFEINEQLKSRNCSDFDSHTDLPLSANQFNNLDEIELSDIMVELINEIPQEEQIEKHDIEKDKQNNLIEVVEEIDEEIVEQVDSDIHINRNEQNNTISNQTPSTHTHECNVIQKSIITNGNLLSAALYSDNVYTSTPIKTDNEESNTKVPISEASQVTHNSILSLNVQQPSDDSGCKLPLNCFNGGNLDINKEKSELLNISQENNTTNQMDEKPEESDDLNNICRNNNNNNDNITSCSYLTRDNYQLDHYLERSCEETSRLDNRMLDPAAMIESLDRFTAELVSQASHLQNKDDKYKITDNTWADDNEITFPSISDSPPNIITFDSNTDHSNHISDNNIDVVDCGGNDVIDCGGNEGDDKPPKSNDFSSLNTTSTLTESTLIALEAEKIATVFKNEAEMSQSINSVASLELDHIQPPSQLNSLNASPKLIQRKKSLPSNLMVRKLLNNNNNSSLNSVLNLENFENYSLLDQVNPPSGLSDVMDLEGSLTSVASLPNENIQQRTDFQINGIVNNNKLMEQSSNLNFTQPLSFVDLDHINAPSFLHEITDSCNSLADVPTEAIGSETEIFEDCRTHVTEAVVQQPPQQQLQQAQQQQTEDDVTEFSDANSLTPLQSDIASSPEMTPKKIKNFTKQMTSKQRRNFARDRYKTYTVAAEMVMKEEQEKLQTSVTEESKTVQSFSENYKSIDNETMYVSTTCSIDKNSNNSSSSSGNRITPKERRQQDRSRFETQIVQEPLINQSQNILVENGSDSSGSTSAKQSPIRSKLSIRRNFIQKRLENKERFKTQTLTEPTLSQSPELSASPPISGEMDLHFLVQKEANLVLKTLKETKTNSDELLLLDYETLSLVSNDDDSEQNSASSANYKTYHKSWGLRKNIPVIATTTTTTTSVVETIPTTSVQNDNNNEAGHFGDNNEPESDHNQQEDSISEDEDNTKIPAKPKIVKPSENPEMKVIDNNDNGDDDGGQGKAIRGRRKVLYSKSNIGNRIAPKNIKPIQPMTSNATKNVVKTIGNKTIVPPKTSSRASSGYGSKPNTPKTSPAHSATNKNPPKSTNIKDVKMISKLTVNQKCIPTPERQGTFTKDETTAVATITTSSTTTTATGSGITKCRIPTKLPVVKAPVKPLVSKLPTRNLPVKSASSDRANSRPLKTFVRSTSADSRDKPSGHLQSSSSSHSLKNQTNATTTNGYNSKKTSIPQINQQRSISNTNIPSTTTTTNTSKQVTSRIASLWKKVEESKKQQPTKKDTRVWIQSNDRQQQNSTCNDNKDGVVMRNNKTDKDPVKRISRLGSFIVMDDERNENPTPICNN